MINLEESSPSHQHLPSWVLKMREKIEASRLVHQETSERLQNLTSSVESLSIQLITMRGNQILQTKNSDTSVVEHLSIGSSALFNLDVEKVPCDIWVLIFHYLMVSEVINCLIISRGFMTLVSANPIWHIFGRHEMAYLIKPVENIYHRPVQKMWKIREHLILRNKCLHFITVMKEQRGTNRSKSTLPHTYTKFDKTVTHPIPVFDGGGLSDKIMSSAESMSTDFRTLAHNSLELMMTLTSGLYSVVNIQLIKNGVISVLISLLGNEEGAVQNYSCHILSNLLLWDSLKTARTGFPKDAPIPVSQQIEACDGRRKLLKLLTSPSACVNLAMPKGNARTNIKFTSSVQGVCNKQASRALIMCFYPDRPVNSSSIFQKKQEHSFAFPPLLGSLWQFTYFHKSGALKDQTVVQFDSNSDGLTIGKGSDSIGSFSLRFCIENDIVGQVIMISKSYYKGNEYENAEVEDKIHRNVDVKHVSYYSDPLGDYHAISPDLDGLWGVWETCSNHSQFELQRGGVFRAFPIVDFAIIL